jgi:hypothetical protein
VGINSTIEAWFNSDSLDTQLLPVRHTWTAEVSGSNGWGKNGTDLR